MDFVITWVNDKDPAWRADYEKYSLIETGEKRECRFRDWDNLHYWFRGVEKFAPWVDRVFLIVASPSQLPEWLNTDHPKLRTVFHGEYIPEELLPTFSPFPIEMFLHLIPDLSEQFVYFNDDFFIVNHIKPERFFRKGLPVDLCAMNAYSSGSLATNCMCNLEIINRNFNKRNVMRSHIFKWFSPANGKHLVRNFLLMWWPEFTGFYDHHLPQPLLKSTLTKVWNREGAAVFNSLKYRFRTGLENTQYLYRYWQLMENRFTVGNVEADSVAYHPATEAQLNNMTDAIRKQKRNIIVVNDNERLSFLDFDDVKIRTCKAFDSILPDRSLFERN
ncbi:MAG: Stealth CR1 domain-containing protein [Cytophagaceae bacterium]|jgi:hypothetical protein|nr:Stealth CR1 domain-containing protein [Cytophagaceae bacterium]